MFGFIVILVVQTKEGIIKTYDKKYPVYTAELAEWVLELGWGKGELKRTRQDEPTCGVFPFFFLGGGGGGEGRGHVSPENV